MSGQMFEKKSTKFHDKIKIKGSSLTSYPAEKTFYMLKLVESLKTSLLSFAAIWWGETLVESDCKF